MAEFKLSLGLSNEELLDPAVAAEFEQLITALQSQFTRQLAVLTQLVDDAADPPGASLTFLNDISLTSGVATDVSYDRTNVVPIGLAEQYFVSPDDMFNIAVPTKIYIRVAGTYEINWSFTFAASAAGARIASVVWANQGGLGLTLWSASVQGDANGNTLTGNVILRNLKVGDYIRAVVTQTSGGALALKAGYPTFIQVVKIA